ncbi:MAG TPA: glycosyltransferase family 2 protein [Solirubrobacterales bacterium]|jgi:hypothetical protein
MGGEAAPAIDVSVVIVAHSARDELERCLASIDRHAGSLAVETILVDNASTDDTVRWARSEHPEVRVVELGENIGVAARRFGLELARGRYAMFLDSDAALTEGALETMVRGLDEHGSWGLVGPRLVGDDGKLQRSCRRFPPLLLPIMRRPPLNRWLEHSRPVRRHLMEDVDPDQVRPVLYLLGACQLFRRELAERLGPPEWVFLGMDDADWCLRIQDAGYDVVYLPTATVVHSYQRRTAKQPLSRAALSHLRSFLALQWRHRVLRRDALRRQAELDRAATA